MKNDQDIRFRENSSFGSWDVPLRRKDMKKVNGSFFDFVDAPEREEDGLDKEQEIEESLKGKFMTRLNNLVQEMTTLMYTVYIA